MGANARCVAGLNLATSLERCLGSSKAEIANWSLSIADVGEVEIRTSIVESNGLVNLIAQVNSRQRYSSRGCRGSLCIDSLRSSNSSAEEWYQAGQQLESRRDHPEGVESGREECLGQYSRF